MSKDTVCVLPWISIDRNTDMSYDTTAPCCLFQPGENIDIKSYWNHHRIKQLRSNLQNGIRDEGCTQCWEAEDKGIPSLRQSVNKDRLHQYKDRIPLVELEQKPVQIKINTGNSCNFSCRMCLPAYSSRVKKVWDVLGRTGDAPFNFDSYYQYVEKNHRELRYIDVLGGEPLFNKKFRDLLTFLIDNKSAEKITLFITTNGSLLSKNIIALLKQFENVVLNVSIDAVGDMQEYIRPGCDWKKLESNLKLLVEENISFQVASTISVLNILHLEELENWCLTNNYHFSQPMTVYEPLDLAPHNLPHQLHEFVPEKYKSFLNQEINDDALNFIKQMDNFWKTDIRTVSPLWNKVWEDLHWHNVNELENLKETALKYVNT